LTTPENRYTDAKRPPDLHGLVIAAGDDHVAIADRAQAHRPHEGGGPVLPSADEVLAAAQRAPLGDDASAE
jgi:hypothetical protein